MDIERELSKIDFSAKSQIKESLRERLLAELRASRELSLDELDEVAVAGKWLKCGNDYQVSPEDPKLRRI